VLDAPGKRRMPQVLASNARIASRLINDQLFGRDLKRSYMGACVVYQA